MNKVTIKFSCLGDKEETMQKLEKIVLYQIYEKIGNIKNECKITIEEVKGD